MTIDQATKLGNGNFIKLFEKNDIEEPKVFRKCYMIATYNFLQKNTKDVQDVDTFLEKLFIKEWDWKKYAQDRINVLYLSTEKEDIEKGIILSEIDEVYPYEEYKESSPMNIQKRIL